MRNIVHSFHGVPPSEIMIPYPSIRSLLDSQVRRYGNRDFLVSRSQNGKWKHLSFQDFIKRVTTLAGLLQSEGHDHGDRIAIPYGEGIGTVVNYFSTWMIGGVAVPITGPGEERGVFSAFERGPSATLIDLPEDALQSPEKFRMGKKSKLRDDVLIAIQDSGERNRHGIVLSHYNILVNAMAISRALGFADDRTILCGTPLSGVTGIVGCVMSALYAGCRVVLVGESEPDVILKLVEREDVMAAFANPRILARILASSEFSGKNLPSRFRGFISSHRHLSQNTVKDVERRLKVPVVPGFESAEATCFSSLAPLSRSAPDSAAGIFVGSPVDSCEMTVLEKNGKECGEGTTGEIVVRGHHVMTGYLNDEEATADAFRSGWLHTGERGFYTEASDGRREFTVTP